MWMTFSIPEFLSYLIFLCSDFLVYFSTYVTLRSCHFSKFQLTHNLSFVHNLTSPLTPLLPQFQQSLPSRKPQNHPAPSSLSSTVFLNVLSSLHPSSFLWPIIVFICSHMFFTPLPFLSILKLT